MSQNKYWVIRHRIMHSEFYIYELEKSKNYSITSSFISDNAMKFSTHDEAIYEIYNRGADEKC